MAVWARLLVATCCSFWLLSCASGPLEVQSTVETHHRLGAVDLGKRVVVLPAQEEKAGTLEFAAYAKFVEDGLRREGFHVVPAGEPAELIAYFGYGIDQGRDEVYSYAVATTTGWTPQVGTRRLYSRAIALHIYDISQGDEPVKLYESSVTSQGSSGTLGEVIDEIVASLFQDFRATGVRTTSVAMKP